MGCQHSSAQEVIAEYEGQDMCRQAVRLRPTVSGHLPNRRKGTEAVSKQGTNSNLLTAAG